MLQKALLLPVKQYGVMLKATTIPWKLHMVVSSIMVLLFRQTYLDWRLLHHNLHFHSAVDRARFDVCELVVPWLCTTGHAVDMSKPRREAGLLLGPGWLPRYGRAGASI